MTRIRVLLVDDHRILRQGLAAILGAERDIDVVGGADDGRAAISTVATSAPHVVVMDVGMQGMNGVEATRHITAAQPQVRIVALSTHADRRYVLGMLEAGARAYVLKSSAAEDLVRAIRAVHRGDGFLSPEIAALVVGSYVERRFPTDRSAWSLLAPREREVLQLVAEGLSSKEVARRLEIALSTVETHRKNIMEKLDLHSVADLTRYAVREGIVALE